MPRRNKLHGVSLRIKVLVPMIAVLVAMLAMTVWFVDYRVNLQVENDAREALKTDGEVFRTLQINHLNYLRLRFQSLAGNPKYRAAFQTRDFNTIQKQLHAILEENDELQRSAAHNEKIAFVLFTPDGEMPGTNGAMIQPVGASSAVVAACRPNIARALNADGEAQAAISDTICVEDKLYNLLSIHVDTPEQIPLGVLTVGEEISWLTAQEYSRVTSRPIVFVANNRPVTSTLEAGGDDDVLQNSFQQASRAVAATDVTRVKVGKTHYFCAPGRFPSLKQDAAIGYLLFSSYDPPAGTLEMQRLLLLASFAAIIGGSIIVWFFVKRAMQPLVELRDSAEAVGRGDFSRRVAVRSRDECGKLAEAFNRMTEDVQQAQTELQKTVTTLKTTQAQLVQSEKLSAVGEFVAGVAHELNNPLAAVMGFSELLRNAPVDEQHRRHLDLIFKSATRCKKIVQSLLSFARRHQPERKPVSVNHLIEEVLEIVAYQLRTSNVGVGTRFAPELPMVLADGHQIQQVILNLVNNARQAIEAHQKSGNITVTTELQEMMVRITIQDDGPGIAPENLKRIFDPFFTTKEVGKGTGLGLSLCYGLIKEHGGSITVESRPGEGAAFIIELPVIAGAAPGTGLTAGPAGTDDPREGAGHIVLLVDDEEMILEMARDGLKRSGYHVVTATSGDAALRELQQGRPDVICTDLKMPGLTGRQLYDWIRVNQPAAARRVIFMTGDIVNPSLQLFLEQEHLVCLNKPFALAELRQAIRKILRENPRH